MRGFRSASCIALLLAFLAAACSDSPPGGEPRSADPPSPPESVSPPEVLHQLEPQLSDEVAEAIWASDRDIRAVIHVEVKKDGSAGAVSVKSAEPADLDVARGFAEEVARSVRSWRFKPAMRAGRAVDAEFDLTVEAQGGRGKETQGP